MNKKWLIVIGSVGVLIAIFAVTNYLLTAVPAPLVVVKDFWTVMELHQNDATQESDFGRAYTHFDSDLQRVQTLQEFQELATSHSSFFRAGNRRWFTNIENGTATVEGRITIQGDVKVSALFRLAKQNDTWRIVAYKIQDGVGGFAGATIP